MKYVALLRGINVGGKAMIKMAELKIALSNAGLENVQTYIQSGNIIFESTKSTDSATKTIAVVIKKEFKLDVSVLVLSADEYEAIIKAVPKGWGSNPEWKYNLLFLLPPYDEKQILKDIGELKPDMETLVPGNGVIYQTISIKLFGRATTGKLASMPIYKKMTIRNNRTGDKLLALL